MKRILFVDDEQRVLDGLRNMLRRHRDEWEMIFVRDGESALEELEKAPVDVLVTDMRMRGMDGPTLLARAQQEYGGTARIVLSGYADNAAAEQVAPLVHQFLQKPCSAELLAGTIERIFELQGVAGDVAVRALVTSIGKLPSVPKTYAALTRTLERPEACAMDVARVIERDVAICAKLLQLVNSSFFTVGMPITSVEHAVIRLGLQIIKGLALSVEVFQTCAQPRARGFDIEALQRHSLQTASVARRLLTDPRSSDDAFMAGMLHDIGQLILAAELPDELDAAADLAAAQGISVHIAETSVLGASHADLGGYLLGLWGLPPSIVAAVGNHHVLHRELPGEFGVSGAVHVANALVHDVEHGDGSPESLDRSGLDIPTLAAFGVVDHVPSWRATAAEILGS